MTNTITHWINNKAFAGTRQHAAGDESGDR